MHRTNSFRRYETAARGQLQRFCSFQPNLASALSSLFCLLRSWKSRLKDWSSVVSLHGWVVLVRRFFTEKPLKYRPREIRFFLFLFAAIIKDRRILLSMAWTFRECVGEVGSWRRVEMIGG